MRVAVLGQEDRVRLCEGESVLAFLRGGTCVALLAAGALLAESFV